MPNFYKSSEHHCSHGTALTAAVPCPHATLKTHADHNPPHLMSKILKVPLEPFLPGSPERRPFVLLAFVSGLQCDPAALQKALGTLDCALVNATLIAGPQPFIAALHRSLQNYRKACMKTRSIYTELLFALSPSTNVTESLKTFGLGTGDAPLLAVRFFSDDADQFAQDLRAQLHCHIDDLPALEDIGRFARRAEIARLFRTTDGAHLDRECCSVLASKGI